MTRNFDYHLSASEGDNQSEGPSAPVVSRWLGPGNRTFLEEASMVVTWYIVAFFAWCSAFDDVITTVLLPELSILSEIQVVSDVIYGSI